MNRWDLSLALEAVAKEVVATISELEETLALLTARVEKLERRGDNPWTA